MQLYSSTCKTIVPSMKQQANNDNTNCLYGETNIQFQWQPTFKGDCVAKWLYIVYCQSDVSSNPIRMSHCFFQQDTMYFNLPSFLSTNDKNFFHYNPTKINEYIFKPNQHFTWTIHTDKQVFNWHSRTIQ